MAEGEGGTQHDLKMGLDTGPAQAPAAALLAEIAKIAAAADSAEVHLKALGTAAVSRLSSAASAANTLTTALGADRSAAAGATAATQQLSSAASSASSSISSQARVTSAAARSTDEMASSNRKASTSFSDMAKSIAAVVLTYVSLQQGISAFKDVVSTFTGVETALIGVQKTAGFSREELRGFYGDIKAMSTSTVPLATSQLLEIGQAAGSLGVTGKENIERYASSVGKLSAASEDLKGAEAATLLTRMMNVQGEGPQNIERLSSVIVRLGLSSAATEREIATVGTEVSKGLAAFRIGTTQAAAYGAALAEMGIEAEAGSTSLQQTFSRIQLAVTEGGKQLDLFAKVSNVSSAEFAAAWKADKVQTLNTFLKGLKEFGDDAGGVLAKLGLPDVRVQKTLETFAFNFEALAAKQRIAAEEAENVTALNEKSAIVFDSTGAVLQALANQYDGVKEAIGNGMAPALRDVADQIRIFGEESEDGAARFGRSIGRAMREVVPLLLAVVDNINLITAALEAWLAIRAFAWIAALSAQIVAWIGAITGATAAAAAQTVTLTLEAGAITAVTAATAAQTVVLTGAAAAEVLAAQAREAAAAAAVVAAQAEVALAAEAAAAAAALAAQTVVVGEGATVLDFYAGSLTAVGAATVRTGTVADLYNAELIAQDAAANAAAAANVRLAAANEALAASQAAASAATANTAAVQTRATATSAGFLSTAITPLAVGLGVLLGALLAANAAVVDFAEAQSTAMQKIIKSNNDFAVSMAQLRNAGIRRGGALSDEALQKEIANEALIVKAKQGSVEYEQIVASKRQEFQRQRVALLNEERAALGENQAALGAHRLELAGLQKQEQSLLAARQKQARAVVMGDDSAVGQLYATDAALAGVRERMGDVENAAAQTSAKIQRLTAETGQLDAATQSYVPAVEKQTRVLGDLGATAKKAKVDKAELHQENLEAKIIAETKAQNELAAAWREGDAAVTRYSEKVAVETKLQGMAAQATEARREALRPLIEDLIHAEAVAKGAEMIAGLTKQLAAQETLTASYGKGAAAVESARRGVEAETTARQNAAGAALEQRGEIERLTRAILAEQHAAEVGDRTASIRLEIESLGRLIAVQGQSLTAIAAVGAEEEREAQRRQMLAGLTDEERKKLKPLIDELLRYKDALAVSTQIRGLTDQISDLQALAAVRRDDYLLEEQYREAVEAVTFALETQKQVREAMANGATPEQLALIMGARAQEQELRKKIEVNSKGTFQPLRDAWENFAGEFRSTLNQMILTGEADWNQLARSFASAMLNAIEDILVAFLKAELVKQAAAARTAAMQAASGGSTASQGASQMMSGSSGYNGGGNMSSAVAAAIFVAAVLAVRNYSSYSKRTWGTMDIGTNVTPSYGMGTGNGIYGSGAGDASVFNANIAVAGRLAVESMKERASAFIDAIKAFAADLGAVVTDLGRVGIKKYGRGGNTHWRVYDETGKLKGDFGTDEAKAMDFALQLAIRQATLSNSSPLTQAALKGSTATTAEGLKSDLEFAMSIERRLWSETKRTMTERFELYQKEMSRAKELFGATDQLGEAQRRLTEAYQRDTLSERNRLLGIEESAAERNAREIAAYNERMETERKAITDQIALLMAELQGVVNTGPRLGPTAGSGPGTGGDGGSPGLTPGVNESVSRALALLSGNISAFGDSTIQAAIATALAAATTGGAADDIRARIQQLQDLLNSEAFRPITPEEQAAAARRLNPGGGDAARQRAEQRRAFQEELRDLERTNMPDAVRAVFDLKSRLADLTKQAKELHFTEAQTLRARQALIDQAKKNILDPVRDWLLPSQGGKFGMNEWQRQQADIQKTFADARAANQALIKETGQRAIADAALVAAQQRAMAALAEAAIDSFGTPLESARDRMKALGDTVAFLRKQAADGVISTERLNQALGELGQQAAGELFGIAADLMDQMGRTDEAARLRRAQDEINFQIQRIQFHILYDSYIAMGIISDELRLKFEHLFNIIDDPTNWPDFTQPAPTGTAPGDTAPPDPTVEWRKVQDEMAAQARQWRESVLLPLVKTATDLKGRYDELVKAAAKYNLSITELTVAYQMAVGKFVDDALKPFAHLGESPLAKEMRELNEQFYEISQAFRVIGASSDAMARLETARAAALADFWKRATDPIRNLVDELTAQDPRKSSEALFNAARDKFRSLEARARGGDLEALGQLEAAGRDYYAQAQAFLGGGVGAGRVLDEIKGLKGLADALSSGQTMDPVANRIDTSNDLLGAILSEVSAGRSELAVKADVSASAASGGSYAAAPAAGGSWVRGPGGAMILTPPRSPIAGGVRAGAGDDLDGRIEKAIAKMAEERRKRDEKAEKEATAHLQATVTGDDAVARALEALAVQMAALNRLLARKDEAGK